MKLGHGCSKCKALYYDTESYIEKVTLLHNNYYDYSETVFVTAKNKLDVICPIHGKFSLLPYNHYKGYGCSLCGIKSASEVRNYTTDQFIDLANKVHNGFYFYIKTNYTCSANKIIVTCPIHR